MKTIKTAVSVCATCMVLSGCCITRLDRSQDGTVKVSRYALLYPASADSVSVEAGNEKWSINKYNSDGGGSNVASIASAVVKAALEAAK